jgi:EmrB/QacA subfamily drug resistance transporter
MKNNKIFILLGIILAIFLCSLDQLIVSTAMPKIVQDLNGIEHLSWVFTAYMLTSTITMAIIGKMADLFGHKKLYLLGILVFLLGSMLSGLSTSMTQLIFFRAIQGIGGGAMMIISFALIADVFPPAEQAKYQGIVGGISALSSIVGPLLGGWITDHFSWRWTFYINMPVGAITLFIIIAALPAIKHKIKASVIDYAGAIFLIVTLVPFLLALVWGGNMYAWNSWEIISLLIISVVSLAAFIYSESKARHAILALDLFKNRVFIISALSSLITAMGMFGVILFIPIFAQGIIGITATHSGLILTPMMVSMIIAAVISGQIISRTGKYKIVAIAGMLIAGTAMYLFSGIGISTTNNELVIRMAILGAGIGLTMPIFQLCAVNAFPVTRAGEVTAGSQLFKGLGGTVGTAVLGGLMNTELASKLSNVASDPFVAMFKKMNPGKPFEVNFKTVQALLNPDVQAKVKTGISKAPEAMQVKISQVFEHFLQTIKIAFSDSLDMVFLAGAFILAAGLIVVFFLPEIPLRKTNTPVIEETMAEIQPVV